MGLGNLWKFPYITWDHGGGGFVLLYLACIVVVGLPLMTAEIVIGRAAQRSVVEAYPRLGGPGWRWAGWLGLVTSVVVFSFYAVVAGWSLYSFVRCLRWSVAGYVRPDPAAFGEFMANGWLQVGLGLAFIAVTGLVVGRGVRDGIDRAARILMPALFVMLLYMLVASLRLPGAVEGLRFMFRLDFSAIDREAVLVAMGHAFFTLTVGIGALIAYGSYLGERDPARGDSLLRTAATITALDTLAALMACGVLFPIIFSVPELKAQLSGDASVSSAAMLFVTLPDLFYRHLPGGAVLAPSFFVLVAFAALSSTIPPLEIVVSTLLERSERRASSDGAPLSRPAATALACALVAVLMVGCALSLGASPTLSSLRPFGPLEGLNTRIAGGKTGVLAVFDHLSANWMLPLGGLITAIFAGWALDDAVVAEQLGGDARGRPVLTARIWRVFVRFVCPAAIGWILLTVLRGGDFS